MIYIIRTNTYPFGTYEPPLSLEEEIKINETADCRIIGLTLETRPDSFCGPEVMKRLFDYGVMVALVIQLGVQTIYDDILKQFEGVTN